MDEKQMVTIGIMIAFLALFLVLVNVLDNKSINGIKAKQVGDGQHGTARWATKQEIFDLSEKLPECNVRQMTKDANRSQYTLVVKPGVSKSRVYKPVLCFTTQNQGNFFVQQIENELQSLGFKHYSVILEKIRDSRFVDSRG